MIWLAVIGIVGLLSLPADALAQLKKVILSYSSGSPEVNGQLEISHAPAVDHQSLSGDKHRHV